MPTPFEKMSEVRDREADWAARSDKPRRSVFGNYRVEEQFGVPSSGGPVLEHSQCATSTPKESSASGTPSGLQAAIDTTLARAFLYQFLARAFEDPTIESWTWLTNETTHAALCSATYALANATLDKLAMALTTRLRYDRFEPFQIAYITAFGHAARGDCPLNEIEYGDLKADPLFQPHRLADLTAFYRAFGLEVAAGAAERPDHIGMELEFMSVLAAKEGYAHEHQLDEDQRALCRDAQRKFLREHLGRWSPAFARRLARTAPDEALGALAEILHEFIVAECLRFGLTAGSQDLLLRPVDEAAESLCASCGLQNLPPGAVATGART